MNRILCSIFLVSLIACKSEKSDDYYSNEKNDVEFIEFRFPEFGEWTECHDEKEVKDYFDSFLMFEKIENVGVYLNNKTYLKKDSLAIIDFEDYAVFMVNVNEQKWKLTGNDLKRIFRIQKRKKGIENFDKDFALNKVYSDTTFLRVDKPVVIEEYKPHPNILSAVKFVKPYSNYHDIIVVYVFNLIVIKNHLVYAGYYLDLNGTESIERVKKTNDKIMKKFVEYNK
ncbi:hypothetical protein LV716_09295 [Flagellimonas sp. HMM57]|uniref:hypothetical protein n=1 Tax=unclassified Flagellimonas TaxID=2644544 RepID=UPI0013D1615C|nr:MULTISPECIES: hypothetical protein [unclassified Flagellimonas]UII74461.1 hypothetical protein LV716_09295 [Flagellimonas sp. HMM57]